MKKGHWRALRSAAASRTSVGRGGNSLRRRSAREGARNGLAARSAEASAHTAAQQAGQLAARQVHDREREQVGQLALAAVAAPILVAASSRRTPPSSASNGLRSARRLQSKRLERGIERELEVLLPHARRIEARRGAAAGAPARCGRVASASSSCSDASQ